MNSSNNFQPNWASTPGDTIVDILRERQLSLPMFAKRMDSTVDHVKELLHGYVAITDDIAHKLEKTIGASAEFWVTRELIYRESIERLKHTEEAKWLKELPVKDMIKYGWINNADNLIQKCLSFFNVPDVWTWRRQYSDITAMTAFRRSSTIKSDPASVATWLRQGEIQAKAMSCASWNPKLFKEALAKIRSFTKKRGPKDFLNELKQECSRCGVALIIARTPAGCSASGATKFVAPDKAMILLSFRYLSDDQFWFTFFHEAAHLLLHNNELLFLEHDHKNEDVNEKEANDFSANILVPTKYRQRLKTMPLIKKELLDFAKEVDISLGIIVGQLQHMGRVEPKNLNGYKRKYSWNDIES